MPQSQLLELRYFGFGLGFSPGRATDGSTTALVVTN